MVVPRRNEVERVTSLREQPELLRGFARSSDIPAIRDELLAMATDCERVAEAVAQNSKPGFAAVCRPRMSPSAMRRHCHSFARSEPAPRRVGS
jgi:hypothetical protein